MYYLNTVFDKEPGPRWVWNCFSGTRLAFLGFFLVVTRWWGIEGCQHTGNMGGGSLSNHFFFGRARKSFQKAPAKMSSVSTGHDWVLCSCLSCKGCWEGWRMASPASIKWRRALPTGSERMRGSWTSNQGCWLQICSSADWGSHLFIYLFIQLQWTLGSSNACIVVIPCQALFNINLLTPNFMGRGTIMIPLSPHFRWGSWGTERLK